MAKSKTTSKAKSSTILSIGMGGKSEMRKWEVESAVSTLQRAAEIQKNSFFNETCWIAKNSRFIRKKAL